MRVPAPTAAATAPPANAFTLHHGLPAAMQHPTGDVVHVRAELAV
jgi:hypothetical protein